MELGENMKQTLECNKIDFIGACINVTMATIRHSRHFNGKINIFFV